MFKYEVQYYRCPECYFAQTEDPYWLDEAYQNALNLSDTGLLFRNKMLFDKTYAILCTQFNKSGKFLDYGGGYGIFVRTMRDAGLDYYWQDAYASNLCARGFEYDPSVKYEALTTFEVFEHLVNPIAEINKMFALSDSIIFSTELIAADVPNKNDWWYYGFAHGQHIAFYSKKSLQFIAKKYGAEFYTDGRGFHVLTKRKFSFFYLTLKMSKLGLSNILRRGLTSKHHSDHLMLSEKDHSE